MARQLRVQYSDALYHVMSRGNNRQNIFYATRDYQKFLFILDEACQKFQIKIGAFCLMPNHYHLLVKTPASNLSDFMKGLNARYAQWQNYIHSKDGHLFQGRYKAILVETDRYLLSLVRYIHLNPVKADIASQAENYPYSSHSWYLQLKNSSWFDSSTALGILSQNKNLQIDAYRKFMAQPAEVEITEFYQRKRPGSILGSPEFKEKLGQALGSDPNVRTAPLRYHSDGTTPCPLPHLPSSG